MKHILILCLALLVPTATFAQFQPCQTGYWYNADRDGEGWNMLFGDDDVFWGKDFFVATFYTFNPNTLKQVWYITGTDKNYANKDQITVPLFEPTLNRWVFFGMGGFQAGELKEVGEVTFSFISENRINVSFFASVDGDGFSPEIRIMEANDFPLSLVTPRTSKCK